MKQCEVQGGTSGDFLVFVLFSGGLLGCLVAVGWTETKTAGEDAE